MNIANIKNRIYNTIRDDDENDLVSNIVDGVIIALIIVNVISVIAETFSLSMTMQTVLYYVEIVSVIVFTIEYILRVWTSDLKKPKLPPYKARLKYIFSFMALIDLFAILPFYLPFIFPIDLRALRMLRVIRLLRIFKVSRYTNALSTIANVFKAKKAQLISSIFVCLLLMIIAAVLMYNIENEAQPEAFENAFDALWWAISTVTTIGYGDIYPITVLGKILSAVISLLGIGLIAVPTGIISAGFTEQISQKDEDANDKQFCPYCGHKLDK